MRPTKRNARKNAPPRDTQTAIIVVWLPPPPPGSDGGTVTSDSDDGGRELKDGVGARGKLPGDSFGDGEYEGEDFGGFAAPGGVLLMYGLGAEAGSGTLPGGGEYEGDDEDFGGFAPAGGVLLLYGPGAATGGGTLPGGDFGGGGNCGGDEDFGGDEE